MPQLVFINSGEHKMRKTFSRSILAAIPLLFAFALTAQDTRKVVEPTIPKACVTLDASIAAPKGVIAERDEKTLDTDRVQHAMDGCAKGQAVVLRASGNKNVFLSG